MYKYVQIIRTYVRDIRQRRGRTYLQDIPRLRTGLTYKTYLATRLSTDWVNKSIHTYIYIDTHVQICPRTYIDMHAIYVRLYKDAYRCLSTYVSTQRVCMFV